jgi:Na+/H+ antiporter NhaD/arsenite permease-like protein
MGVGAGLLSAVVDSFTIAISNISLYQVGRGDVAINGAYWSIIAYSTAVGGCLISVGSISGLALMKMERVRLGWYIKHLTPKVLLGWIVGYVVLWLEQNLIAF